MIRYFKKFFIINKIGKGLSDFKNQIFSSSTVKNSSNIVGNNTPSISFTNIKNTFNKVKQYCQESFQNGYNAIVNTKNKLILYYNNTQQEKLEQNLINIGLKDVAINDGNCKMFNVVYNDYLKVDNFINSLNQKRYSNFPLMNSDRMLNYKMNYILEYCSKIEKLSDQHSKQLYTQLINRLKMKFNLISFNQQVELVSLPCLNSVNTYSYSGLKHKFANEIKENMIDICNIKSQQYLDEKSQRNIYTIIDFYANYPVLVNNSLDELLKKYFDHTLKVADNHSNINEQIDILQKCLQNKFVNNISNNNVDIINSFQDEVKKNISYRINNFVIKVIDNIKFKNKQMLESNKFLENQNISQVLSQLRCIVKLLKQVEKSNFLLKCCNSDIQDRLNHLQLEFNTFQFNCRKVDNNTVKYHFSNLSKVLNSCKSYLENNIINRFNHNKILKLGKEFNIARHVNKILSNNHLKITNLIR
ncbi:MAG: hypothetical protein AAFO15_00960 [Pseudomonadota bacterium]